MPEHRLKKCRKVTQNWHCFVAFGLTRLPDGEQILVRRWSLVMILMALDHTRDFLGVTNVNPADPAQTTIPLFFTRWIPHSEVLPHAETAD
jgi:hypothetical protein